MLHQVLRDSFESLRAGQQRVLRCELTRQLPLGLIVDLGLFEQFIELLGEVLVDQLQLGNTVLVVQRNGRTVGDGVAEVIDTDVVAELLPSCLFLTRNERGTSETHHGCVRQGGAHVKRESVVLAAVRLVSDDDDVRAVRQHRHLLLAFGFRHLELVDQREDVPVVGSKQLS